MAKGMAGLVAAGVAVAVCALACERQDGRTPPATASSQARPATPRAPSPTPLPATRPARERIPDTIVTFEMVRVPGGRLTLTDARGNRREVAVKPFWIGKYEVTWDEADVLLYGLDLARVSDHARVTEMAARRDAHLVPSSSPPYVPFDRGWGHSGSPACGTHPDWARGYCTWLSQKTGKKYRLPTEAEWEWACRAGADKPLKPSKADLLRVGWCAEDAEEQTHPVGKKGPNAWGLHDMLGNVAEWVVMPTGTRRSRGARSTTRPRTCTAAPASRSTRRGSGATRCCRGAGSS